MEVRALTCDVFGTVLDWYGSIVREGTALGRAKGLSVDWGAFALAWRAQYRPMMDRVRRGDLPWMNLDRLHRLILENLLPRFGLEFLTEAERDHLNRVWHRLDPWPDVREGLERLRRRYIVTTLSNGNVALQVNASKRAGLGWDCLFSAEHFRHYKPDPEVYLGAVEMLGLRPEQVLMVAAHPSDLSAARACGLRTALVLRPHEYGPAGRPTDEGPQEGWDMVARDFLHLADLLGA